MDSVEILVKGGKGGDGVTSFRREKYVPKGGPDGGNGGKGGDVYLIASKSVDGLEVFKGRRLFRAGDGGRGQGQRKHGRNGEDLVIEIPVGTEVTLSGEGREEVTIEDAVSAGHRVMVAGGGAGGLGNAVFATPTHQAPEKATAGQPGEEKRLILRVKYVVDAAIVGLPNSGKSALLGAMTAARPRIADYPFTTREAVLGTADINGERLVLVELPALVAGSHAGKGLGDRYLRHAERAGILLILLDGRSAAPWEDFGVLDDELGKWTPPLTGKARLVAVNKLDLPEVKERVPEIKRRLGGIKAVFISALTGEGVPELMARLASMVEEARRAVPEPKEAIAVFRPRPVDEGRR